MTTHKAAMQEVVAVLENVALTLSSLEICLVERRVLQQSEIDNHRPAAAFDAEVALQRLRSLVASLPNE